MPTALFIRDQEGTPEQRKAEKIAIAAVVAVSVIIVVIACVLNRKKLKGQGKK